MPAKVVKIASYPHWFVFYRDMTHALLNHGGGAGGRQEILPQPPPSPWESVLTLIKCCKRPKWISINTCKNWSNAPLQRGKQQNF